MTLPSITTPAQLSKLTATEATFKWTPNDTLDIDGWSLSLGTSTGAGDVLRETLALNVLEFTATHLPRDRKILFARLHWRISGVWHFEDYLYQLAYGSCSPLRFGINNHVVDATLTSTPASVTDINSLKNEWPARQAKWVDLSENIVITGVLPEAKYGEYFCLPSSNLIPGSQIQLELFENTVSDPDLLKTGFRDLHEHKPLGDWRAGIDEYGSTYEAVPGAFTIWFNKPILFKAFRLTITNTAEAVALLSDVRLRMILIGEKLEMNNSFSYGSAISFLTSPELVETTSGSSIPTRPQQKKRKLQLNLSSADDSDRSRLSKFESELRGGYFLISGFPSESGWKFNDYTFLARFTQSLDYTHKFIDHHSVEQMTVVEV